VDTREPEALYLRPTKVARLLNVSRDTLCRMMVAGQIPYVVLAANQQRRLIRIPVAGLTEALARLASK
jgi:excisionase family DNA binding protein